MSIKVMVADDEEGVLALVNASLRADGDYEMFLARDGDEAVSVDQKERPDLLILDVLMPKKDGYEVCRLLKDDPATSSIKVIMLTALAQETDRQKARDAGAEGYITEPFSPTALREQVRHVLEMRPD